MIKKTIKNLLTIFIILVVAGAVYGIWRAGALSKKSTTPDTALPSTNPFDSGIPSPFGEYENPFGASLIRSAALAAQTLQPPRVTFPVKELNNCRNEAACRAYCDRIENIQVCVDFAELHGLLSPEVIAHTRKLRNAGSGPGGCGSKTACDAYCDTLDHIQECVAFAEEYDVLPPHELKEAQRVADYVAGGGEMPGGCQNKTQCTAYCEDATHMRVCIEFAEEAGFLSGRELEEAKKVLPFMERGETPGGCIAKEACDAYCGELEHMQECLTFAEKADLIAPEELAQAKKVLPLMIRGETPGKCTSKEACEAYCKSPGNFEECITFAEKAGLMNKVELALLKRMVRLIPK